MTVTEGEMVEYTLTISNTGDLDLTNVQVADTLYDSISIGDMAAGTTTTVSYSILMAEPGEVENTATATGNYDGQEVRDSSTATVTVNALPRSIDLVKKVVGVADGSTAAVMAGDTVVFEFIVTNDGGVPLTDVAIEDSDIGFSTTIGDLAVDQSVTVTASAMAAAGEHTNTATATGWFGQEDVSDTDSAVVFGADPDIQIIKTVQGSLDGATVNALEGDSIIYELEVTNTGNVDLTDIFVSDPLLGYSTTLAGLAAGADTTLTVNDTVSEGTFVNTATATGWYEEVSVSDSDDATVVGSEISAPDISIVKTVQGFDDGVAANVMAGDTVVYVFLVTNEGNVPLDNVSIDDDDIDFSHLIGNLGVGASMTVTTSALAAEGTFVNTATVSAMHAQEVPVHDTDDAEVFGAAPEIEILKSVDPAEVYAGDDVVFTFMITNTGNVALTDVVLSDEQLDLSLTIGALAIEESVTVTQSATIVETTTNTAVATGWYGEEQVTDSDSAKVTAKTRPAPSISITKTASPTRTTRGSSITFTVVVTNTGNVTLYNINVSDTLWGEDTEVITSMAVGASQTFTYTGSYDTLGDHVNTATAEGMYADSTEAMVWDEDTANVNIYAPSSRTDYYDITITASPAGTASGTGAGNNIREYSSRDLTFTANSGYRIIDVTMDGDSIGAVGSYDINRLTEDLDFVIFTEPIEEEEEIIEEDPTPEAPPEPRPEPEPEEILDMEPEAIPQALPQTGGIPFAVSGILGGSLAGLGLIFRRKDR